MYIMTTRYMIKRENPKNKLLTEEAVQSILSSHGLNIKVNDINIYQTAFVHKSYLRSRHNPEKHDANCVPLQDACYETYEYAGDTILNSVIGTYLYGRYPGQNEGFLTTTRSKMVRGSTLGEMARRMGFGEWFVISQHVEMDNGRDNTRILEDVFESFIAAIFLDNGSEPISSSWFADLASYDTIAQRVAYLEGGQLTLNHERLAEYIELNKQLRDIVARLFTGRSHGYLYCQKFITSAYETHIDMAKLVAYNDNYKDQLQTHFQQSNDSFPTWLKLKEEGKTNNRMHTVGIRDKYGKLIGVGRERKKIDADQAASKKALIHLGIISEDDGNNFFRT